MTLALMTVAGAYLGSGLWHDVLTVADDFVATDGLDIFVEVHEGDSTAAIAQFGRPGRRDHRLRACRANTVEHLRRAGDCPPRLSVHRRPKPLRPPRVPPKGTVCTSSPSTARERPSSPVIINSILSALT